MANQIQGVYEKILECAKKEFLEKGFKESSLRTISQNAGTSTGSIYTRFSDKEGLFEALVSSVVKELKDWFSKEQDQFHNISKQEKEKEAFGYGKDKIEMLVEYIYDNFDIFKLLISCSEGTIFSDFIHDIVEIDVDYTIKFIESTGNDTLDSGRGSKQLFHILSSAFYSGVFEVVVHDMKREEANIYIHQLRSFFVHGWKNILNI